MKLSARMLEWIRDQNYDLAETAYIKRCYPSPKQKLRGAYVWKVENFRPSNITASLGGCDSLANLLRCPQLTIAYAGGFIVVECGCEKKCAGRRT